MAKNNSASNSDAGNAAVGADSAVNAVPEAATPPAPQKPLYEGITNFAYIGPSLPGGGLKSNAVLAGTYEQITDYYKEAIELYPGIEKLFVPASRLADSREKVKAGGNLISKHYQEVAAAIKTKGETE